MPPSQPHPFALYNPALLPADDTGLRQLAVAQGVSENELILATVVATTGLTIGPEIFNPPTPPA